MTSTNDRICNTLCQYCGGYHNYSYEMCMSIMNGGHLVQAINQKDAEIAALRKELKEFVDSEKLLSDAYLRIRSLVDAWDTNTGGKDRFEVTEQKVIVLKERVRELEVKFESGGCGYIRGISDPENHCKHVLWAKQRKDENKRLQEALERIAKHDIYCSDTAQKKTLAILCSRSPVKH